MDNSRLVQTILDNFGQLKKSLDNFCWIISDKFWTSSDNFRQVWTLWDTFRQLQSIVESGQLFEKLDNSRKVWTILD